MIPDGEHSPGVAQGSPMSPLLAILVLGPYLSQAKSVNYADDQIFYGDKPVKIAESPRDGALHQEKKCKVIKEDGVWKSELKFLGMTYKPDENRLYGSPRFGESIPIKEDFIDLFGRLTKLHEKKVLRDLAHRNIFGLVQACLYNGT